MLPSTGAFQYQDYYEPVNDYLKTTERAVLVRTTGDRRYKVGFRSPGVFGRAGYYTESNGTARLVVRGFFNSPSSGYVDSPAGRPQNTGDSVQVYNDGGSLGGFCELEVHGRAVGGNTGRVRSTETFDYWQYEGQCELIGRIMFLLLKINRRDLDGMLPG